MRAAQKGVDCNADAGKVLGDHRRFRGASGNFFVVLPYTSRRSTR